MLGGAALVALLYLAARPLLAARVSGLRWIEFPFAILLLVLAVAFGLRAPKEERAQVPEWRKHEQVVRALPDVELAQLEGALSAWLETGAEPERAAAILARALGSGPDEVRAPVLAASTRRERLRLLTEASHRSDHTFRSP